MISREIYIIFLFSTLLFVNFDISYNQVVLGEEDSNSDEEDDSREKEKEDSNSDEEDIPFILPIPFP